MSSRLNPDLFEKFPPPPEASTGLQRRRSFLRGIAVGAAISFAAVAIAAPGTPPLARSARALAEASLSNAEIDAALREIKALIRAEAELQARIPRSRPGLIIPRNLEDYR